MRKKDELSLKDTCMAHAHPEEMVFVLLGRDPAAPAAIHAWTAERVRLGKNVGTDAQIVSALENARVMELEGRRWANEPTQSTPTREELTTRVAELEAAVARMAPVLSAVERWHDKGMDAIGVIGALGRYREKVKGVENAAEALRPSGIHSQEWDAFVESVNLQSHYATLLNQYDGGSRATFADPSAWVQRLQLVGRLVHVAYVDLDGNCKHVCTKRGEDAPRLHGSWRTQVCLDCGAFRTHAHNADPSMPDKARVSDWNPASEYAAAIAECEEY